MKRHTPEKISKICIKILLVLILTSSCICAYMRRYDIYFYTGNTFFGGKVVGHTFYNIDIAEYFLNKAYEEKIGGIPTPRQWVNYQLSRINFIRGNFSDAIYYANEELRLYPNNCRTHYIRGLAYGYMNKMDRAATDFETFNRTCVKNSWAGHNDLAWFYFQQGDIKKMRSTIEEVTSLYPNNPWVQNTYGLALLNSGEYIKAKEALTRAKAAADSMTEKSWGQAYPGNNPQIYSKGLDAMKKTITENLRIVEEKVR